MRRVCIVFLALALGACTHAAPRARNSASAKRRALSTPISGASRLARMQSGTDAEPGTLISWCQGSSCERPAKVRAPRRLAGDSDGLLLFQVPSVPLASSVAIETASGREIARGDLTPGTTMAFTTKLTGGSFTVRLLAHWREGDGTWVFGLKGPAGGT